VSPDVTGEAALNNVAADAVSPPSTVANDPNAEQQASEENPSVPADPLAEAAQIIEELATGFVGEGELEIIRDEEADRFVYQSVSPETQEVIRQFPPEELLRVVRYIREVEGLILDETA